MKRRKVVVIMLNDGMDVSEADLMRGVLVAEDKALVVGEVGLELLDVLPSVSENYYLAQAENHNYLSDDYNNDLLIDLLVGKNFESIQNGRD